MPGAIRIQARGEHGLEADVATVLLTPSTAVLLAADPFTGRDARIVSRGAQPLE